MSYKQTVRACLSSCVRPFPNLFKARSGKQADARQVAPKMSQALWVITNLPRRKEPSSLCALNSSLFSMRVLPLRRWVPPPTYVDTPSVHYQRAFPALWLWCRAIGVDSRAKRRCVDQSLKNEERTVFSVAVGQLTRFMAQRISLRIPRASDLSAGYLGHFSRAFSVRHSSIQFQGTHQAFFFSHEVQHV